MQKCKIKKEVEDRLFQKIWQTKENSNQTFSYSAISWNLSGEMMKKYVLDEIYPKKISNAHKNGDLHIHNLYMGITGYCCGWSLIDILCKGIVAPHKVCLKPAKHFSSILYQLVNFLGLVSNEWSGAQALNSFDVLLAPFVKKDRLSYEQVKQLMQGFIYSLNLPTRWGGQTPFTNITFDLKVPEDLADRQIIIGGKLQKEKYKDFQKECDMINRAFMEIMTKGNSHQRVLSFPIPTYNITKDFDWNSSLVDLLFEMATKYGLPYFQNFINTDMDPHSIRAMCCHLRLDLSELNRRVGGFFGYADKTGSIGVVTINMARIGYLAKSKEDFFKRLDHLLEMTKEALEIKRKDVEKRISLGLVPYTKEYLNTLKYHFSTIGIIGVHEACLNFLNKGIDSIEGKAFATQILNFIRDKIKQFQRNSKTIFNLEATPAESCGYKFALLDKKKYPNIKVSGKKEPYYTNSTCLPLNYTSDLFQALDHQNDLQSLYTGGTVFHIFLNERLNAKEGKLLIKKVLENYNLPYVTLTPTFSICDEHGYLKGEHFKCPHCHKRADVYSRVVGFFTPIQNWHKGKQEEYRNRLEYSKKCPG